MKQKVLVISQPFLPVVNGFCKCLMECCTALKDRGCELYYLSPSRDLPNNEMSRFFGGGKTFQYKRNQLYRFHPLKVLYRIKHRICKYDDTDLFYAWGIEKYVNKLNDIYGFDACLINYLTMSRLYKACNIKKKIILTHDAFTNKDEILHLPKFWFMLKPNDEAKGIRRCTDILSVQQDERTLFQYYHPQGRHYTIFCRMPLTLQSLTYNNNVLFIAGNNQLNLNGIMFFLNEVLPLVKEKTSIRLLIGGTICNALTQYSGDNSIQLLGKVEDIDKFYSKGDIAVNPIYQGTGLKIKTMESLSYGKVTIVHNHSVKGIYKSDTAPLLVATNAMEFADLVVQALTDKKLREEMSERSLNYIQTVDNYVDGEYDRLLDS